MPQEMTITTDEFENVRQNLIDIRAAKKLSYDEIVKRCLANGVEVSKTTVATFFTNPETDIGYRKFNAINQAVIGYDVHARELTEEIPLPAEEKADYFYGVAEIKKDRINDLTEQLIAEREEFKKELKEERDRSDRLLREERDRSDKQLTDVKFEKNKQILYYRISVLFMILTLAVLFAIDIASENHGFFFFGG